MFPSVNSLSERLRAVAQASVDSLDQAGQALHVRGQQQQQQGPAPGQGKGTHPGEGGAATQADGKSPAGPSAAGSGAAAGSGPGVAGSTSSTPGSPSLGRASTQHGSGAGQPQSPINGGTAGSPRSAAAATSGPGGALASRLSGLLGGSTTTSSHQQPVRSASSSSEGGAASSRPNGSGGAGLDRASSLQDRLRGAAKGGKSGAKTQQQTNAHASSSSKGLAAANFAGQEQDRRASVPSVVAPSTAAEIALTEADASAQRDRQRRQEQEEQVTLYERLMAQRDPDRPETIPLPPSPVSMPVPFPLTIPAIVPLTVDELEDRSSVPSSALGAGQGLPLRHTSPTIAMTASPLHSPAATAAHVSTSTLGSGSSMFNTPRNHFPSTGIPKSPVLAAAAPVGTSSSQPGLSNLTPAPPPPAKESEVTAQQNGQASTDLAARRSTESSVQEGKDVLPAAEMDREIRDAEAMLAEEVVVEAEPAKTAPSTGSASTVENGSKEAIVSSVAASGSNAAGDPSETPSAAPDKISRVNELLRNASPLLRAGIDDTDALDGWLRMVNGKLQVSDEEVRRLSDKISLQESRLEEIRETHRLESVSSTALIQQLRDQITKSEVNLSSQASQTLQIAQLKADLATSQTRAKEEEEKRSKAIALLKTVRAKLVKTEKEKEEYERFKAEEKAERAKLVENMERQRAEREREVSNLRASFEKEVQGLKERYERDALAKKREWELEMITTKASHAKDLAAKSKTITSLNEQLRESSDEKRRQFELLQSRQEELEGATAARESSEARMKELQHQLREATERAALAEEALAESKQVPARESSTQAATAAETPDIHKLLSEANAKAESKLAELRDQIARLERERVETDEEHARQLRNRGLELEKMRHLALDREREYADALKSKKASDEEIATAAKVREALRHEVEELKESLRKMRSDTTKIADAENSAREALQQQVSRIDELNQQLEDARQEVVKQKTANRTVREEMRRLQSSIQLMERQRNPGVGYWSAANGKSGKAVDSPGDSGRPSGESSRQERPPTVRSPTPSEVGSSRNEEEEVNLEYLRNVILQFLENKEMRPNLVRVLSVILRFTPQELRRLNAKLNT